MIIFRKEQHAYESVNENPIEWISVTTLISHLKKAFDAEYQARKSAQKKTSKWYGMSHTDILATWKAESDRAIRLGNFYHQLQEDLLCSMATVDLAGKTLPVIKPISDEAGNRIAPLQRLEEGLYPEHFVYLKSAGICGQSDLVQVCDNTVSITDYKTNKEIKQEGFVNWDGTAQKMLFPVSHLDDCNLKHYQLQLSLYLYMILKHNPRYRPGKLTIHHVQFEEEGQDRFGYPITRKDEQGRPIIKGIVPYELPYLRDEVVSLIHWLHENKSKLPKRKTA